MKLWSKEALVLGGVYGALDTLFSLLGVDFLSDVIFLSFFVCVIMLLFNKIPKFISFMMNKYPRTTYYLAAIGWIPYLMLVITFVMMGSYQIWGYADTVLGYLLFGQAVLELLSVIISLIVAYLKAKKIS